MLMRQLPPLTELRAFEAAARHLSFKKAAAELCVTPTAISHQIKLLERYCGRALFRRRPRPLKLTLAGEQLFPVIRDGFETFADVLGTVRASAIGGRLRITATNAFAARWLVPRLPKWREAHPRLKLDIQDKRGYTALDTALGLAGGFGFGGTSGVAHEETAKVIRELGGVPGKPIPGAAPARSRNADDPQDNN